MNQTLCALDGWRKCRTASLFAGIYLGTTSLQWAGNKRSTVHASIRTRSVQLVTTISNDTRRPRKNQQNTKAKILLVRLNAYEYGIVKAKLTSERRTPKLVIEPHNISFSLPSLARLGYDISHWRPKFESPKAIDFRTLVDDKAIGTNPDTSDVTMILGNGKDSLYLQWYRSSYAHPRLE